MWMEGLIFGLFGWVFKRNLVGGFLFGKVSPPHRQKNSSTKNCLLATIPADLCCHLKFFSEFSHCFHIFVEKIAHFPSWINHFIYLASSYKIWKTPFSDFVSAKKFCVKKCQIFPSHLPRKLSLVIEYLFHPPFVKDQTDHPLRCDLFGFNVGSMNYCYFFWVFVFLPRTLRLVEMDPSLWSIVSVNVSLHHHVHLSCLIKCVYLTPYSSFFFLPA